MDCSTPGLPVHHLLPGFTQTHVLRVSAAIQPSHPLSSPSPPAFNLSSIRVFSKGSVLPIRCPKYWLFSFKSVFPLNIQDWFPLGLTGWISLQSKGRSSIFSNTTIQNIKNYNKRSRQTALRIPGKKEFHQNGKSDTSNHPLPTGKPKNVLKEETESRLAEGWAAAFFDALLPPMNSPLFCCCCCLEVLSYLPTAGQKPHLPHWRSSNWVSHSPLHHVQQCNRLFQFLSKST